MDYKLLFSCSGADDVADALMSTLAHAKHAVMLIRGRCDILLSLDHYFSAIIDVDTFGFRFAVEFHAAERIPAI